MQHLIAKGATADLYRLEDGRVFKCFHRDKPDASIENEYSCTKTVGELDLGAPRVYERVNDARGRGYIMEYIPGQSLLDVLRTDTQNIPLLVRQWTYLQLRMHEYHGLSLPNGKAVLTGRITRSSCLEPKQRQRLLNLAASLPDGDSLCHGDYHPGNVMISGNSLRVIDFCDAMTGSRWMDVAATMLLLAGTDGSERESDSLREQVIALYRQEYESMAGESREETEGWMSILAAGKLDGTPGKLQKFYRFWACRI